MRATASTVGRLRHYSSFWNAVTTCFSSRDSAGIYGILQGSPGHQSMDHWQLEHPAPHFVQGTSGYTMPWLPVERRPASSRYVIMLIYQTPRASGVLQVLPSTKKVKCDMPQASASWEPKAEPFLARKVSRRTFRSSQKVYTIASLTGTKWWPRYSIPCLKVFERSTKLDGRLCPNSDRWF
jgi:hypothetical protein